MAAAGIASVCRLLADVDVEALQSLARTVCGSAAPPEGGDLDLIIQSIVQHSAGDPAAFLRRKKVHQKLLFAYLQSEAPITLVDTISRGLPTKDSLVRTVLAFWADGSTSDNGASAASTAPAVDGVSGQDEGAGVAVDDQSLVRMEEILPDQVWAQIVVLTGRDWTPDECARGVRLQAAAQNCEQTVAMTGIENVSQWLRALSAVVVMNHTSSECTDIGHGHGFRVNFRGNLHRDEAIAGMFQMNVLLAPDPAADGELRIQLVEVQLVMHGADALVELVPFLASPEEVLAIAPPP